MTNIYFLYGKVNFIEGKGQVRIESDSFINIEDDVFFLFGDASGIKDIYASSASLDAKNATMNNRLSLVSHTSKAENINNAKLIWLWDGSSVLNSSTNKLEAASGNNIIDGVVSAKEVIFGGGTLSVAKDAVFKVPNKNALDFSKISGEGKIYIESEHAYYSTDGHTINNANLLGASIKEHNFAVAKAIEKVKDKKVKDKMDIYIDGHEHQKYDVDLLNIEMINNDNLL